MPGLETQRPAVWGQWCCCVTAQDSKAGSVGSCCPLDKTKHTNSKDQTSFMEYTNPFRVFVACLPEDLSPVSPRAPLSPPAELTAASILKILKLRTLPTQRMGEAAPSCYTLQPPHFCSPLQTGAEIPHHTFTQPRFAALNRAKTKLVQSLKHR